MSALQSRAKRFKRQPLEQLAYEAFRDSALTPSPKAEAEWFKAWADWAAVKEGRAEPLPQFRID